MMLVVSTTIYVNLSFSSFCEKRETLRAGARKTPGTWGKSLRGVNGAPPGIDVDRRAPMRPPDAVADLRGSGPSKATAKSRKPQIPPIDSQMSPIASHRAESEEEVARRLNAGRICVISAEICAICGFARKGLARIGASALPQPCRAKLPGLTHLTGCSIVAGLTKHKEPR